MSVPNLPDVAGPLPTAQDQPVPAVPALPPPAPPIPPAAVAGSPASAPIPAAPPPAIPEIPITADVPAPTNPVQAAQQISRQTAELGKEEVTNQQQKTVLDQEQAAKKQAFDEANAQALETFQRQQALHREAATAQVQNLQNQYESQPFTSLWSKLSTGQRVATALSVLAAGISWNSNHTNRALDMLDKAESEDLDIQKEQHASLLHSIQLAMEGRKDLEASQLHELSDWQAMQAAKWQAISSKLQSLLATNKGNIDTTAVKKAALEANAKANQGVEGAITAKSTANHMDAESNLARENAKKVPSEIKKNEAEAAAYLSNGVGPNGLPITKQQIAEGQQFYNELKDATKPVTDAKNGIGTKLREMQTTLDKLKNDPNNPVEWTNAIDAAIRTNTGKAAIKAQYDLYRSHARGSVGSFDSWLESKKSGGLGEEEKRNFMGSFQQGYNELRGEAKKEYDKVNEYKNDPRVKRNPVAAERLNAHMRNVFQDLPGYGEGSPAGQPGAAQPTVGQKGTDKNGKIVTWDGKGWAY